MAGALDTNPRHKYVREASARRSHTDRHNNAGRRGSRMNRSSARSLDTALLVAGLGFGTGVAAEPGRAEELEQLRINTAYLIEAGEFEIDIVPFYFDHDDRGHHGVEAEFEYAVSERVMVEVEVPYHWLSFDGEADDVDGTGNVEVAAKWRVTERGGFAMGFNVGVELPASDDLPSVADELWGVELTVPVSLHFPDHRMRLHIEPGVGWQEHEGFEEQLLNIALEHRPGAGNFALQLGSNIVREAGDVEAYLVPAFEVAAATVPFQFGMAFAAGLTSESANWGVLLDFEVEF